MVYVANHLKSRLACRMFHHDPADATVATKIGWVAMGIDFLAIAQLASGTGLLTFKIFAATDSSGTGATEVAAHADPTVADAAGDQVVLEVSAEQVKAALSGATHVSVEIDADAAGDIVDIAYIMNPRDKTDGLTADIIA